MQNKISKKNYMLLLGLKTLANSLISQLEGIVASTMSITREQDEFGHSSDMVYGTIGVDEMLKKLQIEVEKE